MDYLQKAYLTMVREKDLEEFYKLRPHERDRTLSFVEKTFEDEVFDRMLKEGGTITAQGVLYHGFDYRYANARDSQYYKDVIFPHFAKMGIPSEEAYYMEVEERPDFDVMLKILSDYTRHGEDKNTYEIVIDNMESTVREQTDDKTAAQYVRAGGIQVGISNPLGKDTDSYNPLAAKLLRMPVYGALSISGLDCLDKALMESEIALKRAEILTLLDKGKDDYEVER